jgi:hypothetical protein
VKKEQKMSKKKKARKSKKMTKISHLTQHFTQSKMRIPKRV